MPIVKDFGYGTHLNECPEILNQFDYVGVALLDEAIALRKNGYKNKILILYPLSIEEFEKAKKYDFILNGSNIFELNDQKTEIRVHTEIETGMGRTGLQIKNIDKYILNLKNNKNVVVDGLFTHLSTNTDESFSLKQIELFDKAIAMFKDNGINPNNIHISSSGGLKYYKNHLYNMVRVGLLIYGYYPNDSLKNDLDIEPSVILKSNISFLKTIDIGETVGYNKNFVAERQTKVATIPFGFADGLLTLETGEPYVIVKGKKAKIIGICMDNMMLDVTEIENVNVGDIVYIWDNKELVIDQVGKWCNGICNYEVMSSISERVPRLIKR
jgi:alanine racemase